MPFHEHGGHDRHDDDRRQIHDALRAHEMPGLVHDGRTGERRWKLQPEFRHHALEIARPAVRDGRRPDGVLEDEVPTDDPGEQFAERGVRICVGGACHGHHRRKLGIAQRREDTGDARHDVRQHERGSGHVVGGRARRDKNPRADDRAHAEARELNRAQHAAQPVLTGHLLEQLLERFRREQRAGHGGGLYLGSNGQSVEVLAHARPRITACQADR